MNTRKMKLLFFTLVLILGVVPSRFCCLAQEKEELTIRDRFFFGGNLGLQFSNVTTQVEIAPFAGYRITPRLSAGAGLKYEYFGQNYYNDKFHTSVYGADVFTNYTFLKGALHQGLGIMVQAEDEMLNLEKKHFGYPETGGKRFWLNSVLAGGGLKQHLGGRSNVYFLLMYVLTGTSHSPYSNPVIRIGFTF